MIVGQVAFIYDLVLDNVGHTRCAAVAHHKVVLVEILKSLCDLGEKRGVRAFMESSSFSDN